MEMLAAICAAMAENIFTAKLGEVKSRERLPRKDRRRPVDRNPGDVKTKDWRGPACFTACLPACLDVFK